MRDTWACLGVAHTHRCCGVEYSPDRGGHVQAVADCGRSNLDGRVELEPTAVWESHHFGISVKVSAICIVNQSPCRRVGFASVAGQLCGL